MNQSVEGKTKMANLAISTLLPQKILVSNTLIVKLANVDSNDIVVQAQILGSATSSEDIAYMLTARDTIDNLTDMSIITRLVSAMDDRFSIMIPSCDVSLSLLLLFKFIIKSSSRI